MTVIFLSAIEEHGKLIFGESMHRKDENDVKSVSFYSLSNSRTLPSYHVMVYLLLWSGGMKRKRKKVPRERERGGGRGREKR